MLNAISEVLLDGSALTPGVNTVLIRVKRGQAGDAEDHATSGIGMDVHLRQLESGRASICWWSAVLRVLAVIGTASRTWGRPSVSSVGECLRLNRATLDAESPHLRPSGVTSFSGSARHYFVFVSVIRNQAPVLRVAGTAQVL